MISDAGFTARIDPSRRRHGIRCINMSRPDGKESALRGSISGSRGPWGPGPPLSLRFYKNHATAVFRQFEQILGSGPSWGQNSAGSPPDQIPGSAPGSVALDRGSWAGDKMRAALRQGAQSAIQKALRQSLLSVT